MTWKEIKDKIESLGVTDDTKIWLIEISGGVKFIEVDSKHEEVSITNN